MDIFVIQIIAYIALWNTPMATQERREIMNKYIDL